MTKAPDPFVVSLSNRGRAPIVLQRAQDGRRKGANDFSMGALRLAGLAPRLLGWPPDDFWKATPAELAAILCTDHASPEQPLSRAELDHLLERERDG